MKNHRTQRNKEFYVNAIRMDLLRIVAAAGDTKKDLPKTSILEFLTHAATDFDKIQLSKHEKKLKNELNSLTKKINSLNDPLKRLRWAEDILTIRCRL